MIYLLQVSACTAIFFLIYYLMYQGKSNHLFNRFFLLSALAMALFIPLLQIPVFPEYRTIGKAVEGLGNSGTDGVQGEAISWMGIITILYLAGVLLHFLVLAVRLYRLAQIIQTGKRESAEGYVKVYTKTEIPLSSFLSYLIIPDDKRTSLTAFELTHEKSHITQRHSMDILFIELMRVVFWFNPIVLLYKRALIEVHEFQADESTIAHLGKEAYEAFLIQQISTTRQTPLAHNFYSLFKKRIHMMNSKMKTKNWQYLMILPVVAVCFSLFSLTTYPVYQQEDVSGILKNDTFPPLPPELIGKTIDTVLIFDPETKTETVRYIEYTRQRTQIDTVIVFDPETKTETIQYVRSTPQTTIAKNDPPASGIDTVITFDSKTFEEEVIIINHNTGTIDTIK